MSLSLSYMLRVRVSAEQPLQFLWVFELPLDHPALAVRMAVHGRGILLERFFGLEDRAREGKIQLGHGFHRLDRPEDVALLECGRPLRQLDKHHVSQLALSIVGDPDFDDLRIMTLADPLVILCIAQLFGDARHGSGAYNRSARGASPAPSSSLSATRSRPHGRKSSRTAIGSGAGERW